MSQIVYLVKITTAPGRRDDAAAILSPLVDATAGEAGTVQYVMHADTTDADTIWFYEVYADQAAFDAHIGSSAMAEVGGKLGGGLLAGPPDMRALEVIQAKGGA